MPRTLLALCALSAAACTTLPDPDEYHDPTARRAGVEVRGYPAGVTMMAHSQWPVGQHDAWFVAAGANLTDRRDLGEHYDEQGGGGGIGGGWRRYRDAARSRWYWGGRVDLWSLDIDWEDDGGADGTSQILVLQPTVEGGYAWVLGGPWVIEAGLGLGAEINVQTDGEDVGEGAILLGGVTVSAGF